MPRSKFKDLWVDGWWRGGTVGYNNNMLLKSLPLQNLHTSTCMTYCNSSHVYMISFVVLIVPIYRVTLGLLEVRKVSSLVWPGRSRASLHSGVKKVK